MIAKFFNWLGRVLVALFGWLASLLVAAFNLLTESISNIFTWIYNQIVDLGHILIEFLFDLVPHSFADNADFQTAIAFLRNSWFTFDLYVPLSEGLAFVTIFFTFYFAVKSLQIVIRIILAVIP